MGPKLQPHLQIKSYSKKPHLSSFLENFNIEQNLLGGGEDVKGAQFIAPSKNFLKITFPPSSDSQDNSPAPGDLNPFPKESCGYPCEFLAFPCSPFLPFLFFHFPHE